MGSRRLDSGHFESLNALRLILALMVMASHSVGLCWGNDHREFLIQLTRRQESFGSIAVDGFFLISGMLITASWFRCGSMQVFLYRRVLRIYPAFVVALLFSGIAAFAFCPELRQQVNLPGYAHALVHDAALLGTQTAALPGAFQHNPVPAIVNGSLWTIDWEFRCYLLVAVLGLFCLLHRRKAVLTAFLLTWILYAHDVRTLSEPWRSEFRLLAFFLAGMVAWLYRDKLVFSVPRVVACAAVLLVTARFAPLCSLALPLAGSYLLLWIAAGPGCRAIRWTNKTDLSYGVYLYAFPIQQILAQFPALRRPALNLALAIPLTLGCAFLSWRFVEKPCLSLKKKPLRDYDPALDKPRQPVPPPVPHPVHAVIAQG